MMLSRAARAAAPALVGIGAAWSYTPPSCEEAKPTTSPLLKSRVLRESFCPDPQGSFVSGRLKIEHHMLGKVAVHQTVAL